MPNHCKERPSIEAAMLFDIYKRQDVIIHLLKHILHKENVLMANFDALNATVSANSDLVASAVAMITGIKAQIADLSAQLEQAIKDEADQAAIDSLTAKLNEANAALAAVTAVTDNTGVSA